MTRILQGLTGGVVSSLICAGQTISKNVCSITTALVNRSAHLARRTPYKQLEPLVRDSHTTQLHQYLSQSIDYRDKKIRRI